MTSEVKRGRGLWRRRMSVLLLTLAGAALLGSLFLVWSHQLSPSLLARYGASPVLRGVPRDPTGWQVYSIVDGLLAALAGALVVCSLVGGRAARLAVAGCVLVALAFVVHAIKVPPANGANVFDALAQPPGYVANAPRSGPGEIVALISLLLATAGLALALTPDAR